MFRDQQKYRAVAFRTSLEFSLEDLISQFPSDLLERTENEDIISLDNSSTIFKIQKIYHYYYYSPRIFTTSEIPIDKQKSINNINHFRYNMYIFSIRVKNSLICFIAIPFTEMALEIYPVIRRYASGKGLRYLCTDLSKLLESISKISTYSENISDSENAQNNENDKFNVLVNIKKEELVISIDIKSVKFKIEGDGKVDSLLLNGQDIPHSNTLQTICPPMSDSGIKYTPEKIKICFKKSSSSLTLELDQSGHYKFHVNAGASNLYFLGVAMCYFQSEKILKPIASFPSMRSLKEEKYEMEINNG